MARTQLARILPALAVVACSAEPVDDRARRPDVVLLSLDTFRRDALGVLAPGRRSATPRLDGLAADAVLFTTAYAPVPFTLSSHMSLLTGVYPDAHGVVDEGLSLGSGLPTLAELLRRGGYRSEAVVTSRWLDASFGFDHGFDGYVRLPEGLSSARRVTDAALEILDRRASGEDRAPLFLFLHYYEAHSDFRDGDNRWPYYAPPEHRPQAGEEASWCTREGVCATGFLDSLNRRRRRLPADRLEALRALYDGGVRTLDLEIGRLLDELHRRGSYDGSLLVVTADHGEEFQEHGQLLHSQPYDETVVVPLLVKRPAATGGGRRLDVPVALVDVAPTLLDQLGLERPDHLQGRSLLPLLAAGEAPAESLLSQDKGRRTRYALRLDRWKLVLDLDTDVAELYELQTDPGEQRNLAARHPAEVERLRSHLASILTRSRDLSRTLGAVPATPLPPEHRDDLRALGYLD